MPSASVHNTNPVTELLEVCEPSELDDFELEVVQDPGEL